MAAAITHQLAEAGDTSKQFVMFPPTSPLVTLLDGRRSVNFVNSFQRVKVHSWKCPAGIMAEGKDKDYWSRDPGNRLEDVGVKLQRCFLEMMRRILHLLRNFPLWTSLHQTHTSEERG